MALVWPGRYDFYNKCVFSSLLALNVNEPTVSCWETWLTYGPMRG